MSYAWGRRGALLIGMGAAGLAGCEDAPPEGPAWAQAHAPVVYGADDRLDVHAVEDPVWRERATQSAVTLVPPDRLVIDAEAGTVTLDARGYGESLGLCADERFFDQLRLGRCSGTLVDTDLVLTAGHCVPNQARCDDRRFVFGWAVDDPEAAPTVALDDIYTCAEIVLTVDTDRGGQRLDYAFIRLDRAPPPPYAPAPLRPDDLPMAVGDPVTLIGFPNGLPVKVAANGAVVVPRAEQRDFFEATVDAFGGNSGSGVYDAQGQVAGVLVRGEQDYRETDAGCDVVNTLDAERTLEEGAEDVTYVARAVEDLCLNGYRGDRLCVPGDQTWCFPCEADADCREGWTCRGFEANQRVRFCSAPCEADADCRADHACADGGCTPRLAPACVGPDVWARDACRRNVAPTQACPDDQRCGEGVACEPAPPGDRCGAPLPIEAVSQVIEGDLAAGGFGAYASGSCAGRGPEVVYGFTLDRPRPFEATAVGFDTVLHLRRGCDVEEVACDDDSDPPGERGSRIAALLPAGDYQLFMDAYGSTVGAYVLTLTFGESPCEPVVCAPGEARCDGDGVATCAAEAPDACPAWGAPAPCAAGEVCEAGACIEAPLDATAPDGGPLDGGLADGGLADAEPVDGAPLDGGGADLSPPDAALLDAAAADAARPDAATLRDSGADGGNPRPDGAPRSDGGGSEGSSGDGGCRSAPGPAPAWPFALLGLLGLRRRRRRR